jgi:hypothetical protein
LELLTIGRSECTIVDDVTNLAVEDQRRAATIASGAIYSSAGSPGSSRLFGDRGADAQSGAVAVQSLWTAAPMEDSHD